MPHINPHLTVKLTLTQMSGAAIRLPQSGQMFHTKLQPSLCVREYSGVESCQRGNALVLCWSPGRALSVDRQSCVDFEQPHSRKSKSNHRQGTYTPRQEQRMHTRAHRDRGSSLSPAQNTSNTPIMSHKIPLKKNTHTGGLHNRSLPQTHVPIHRTERVPCVP